MQLDKTLTVLVTLVLLVVAFSVVIIAVGDVLSGKRNFSAGELLHTPAKCFM
jgi:hypothetical protein